MRLCRASGTTLAFEKEQTHDSAVYGPFDPLIGFHLHFPEFQLHVCHSV